MPDSEDTGYKIQWLLHGVADTYTADAVDVTVSYVSAEDNQHVAKLLNIRADQMLNVRLAIHKIMNQYGARNVSIVAGPVSRTNY